jgi:hypothetical protein
MGYTVILKKYYPFFKLFFLKGFCTKKGPFGAFSIIRVVFETFIFLKRSHKLKKPLSYDGEGAFLY